MDYLEQRNAVVKEAETWLRTPYHHMGRIKGAGVDCATLLAEVYPVVMGWSKVEVPYYPQAWHLHRDDERYLEQVMIYGKEVEEPLPGDIVVFRYGRSFSHGGIVVAWPTIIHAYVQARGVVLENVELNKELSTRVRRYFSPWSR